MLMLRIRSAVCLALIAISICARNASAVGWGPTDFLITGAPNFPDRIGVFSQDLAFKGYLDTNFLGVQGFDFDAQGNLVAQASLGTNPEVRVYSPNGSRIGGFFTNNPSAQYTGDIKVSPDGNYALGTYTAGVQIYSPNGTIVTQYGGGDSRGITYVPGNRLWSGGAGSTVRIFDTISGEQVGTFTADQQTMSYSMQYSSMTNTVLVVDQDRDAGGVYERDLAGTMLREFHVPQPQVSLYSATRGPSGNVYGAAGKYRFDDPPYIYYDAVGWSADGMVATPIACYPVQISAVRILWAGTVPEPATVGLLSAVTLTFMVRRPDRVRVRSHRAERPAV
jgi:hypothetical protein